MTLSCNLHSYCTNTVRWLLRVLVLSIPLLLDDLEKLQHAYISALGLVQEWLLSKPKYSFFGTTNPDGLSSDPLTTFSHGEKQLTGEMEELAITRQ